MGRLRVVNWMMFLILEKGEKGGWKRVRRDDDWFFVLYRDIRVSKIFF